MCEQGECELRKISTNCAISSSLDPLNTAIASHQFFFLTQRRMFNAASQFVNTNVSLRKYLNYSSLYLYDGGVKFGTGKYFSITARSLVIFNNNKAHVL